MAAGMSVLSFTSAATGARVETGTAVKLSISIITGSLECMQPKAENTVNKATVSAMHFLMNEPVINTLRIVPFGLRTR